MSKKLHLLICFVASTFVLAAQDYTTQNLTINTHVDGTLLSANTPIDSKLVIFIGGSGPTDRDGNQAFMKNDVLKKLAEFLAKSGISTFRYDKRIVKQIRTKTIDKNILFDDFVTDAKTVISYFKPQFDKIIIAGHSQGSLVGLLAIDSNVTGFISLCGAAKSIDQILEEQISKAAPIFLEDTKRILAILKDNKTTEDYPPALSSIFQLDIQPFMSNWMQYNPAEILSETNIPSLIIGGDKDLQVGIEDAQILDKNASNSELLVVNNMNHVLVKIEGDDLENSKSYNDNTLEIAPEVTSAILKFVSKL